MLPKTKMVGIRKVCFITCKFTIYIGCILAFWFNSYMIFQDWRADTTMVSTKVVKAPDNSLDSPILLICNTSAYKKPFLEINMESYKNNTMSFNDALIDVFLTRNQFDGSITEIKPVSIKEYSTKDITTIIHGTCFIIDAKTKVNYSLTKFDPIFT